MLKRYIKYCWWQGQASQLSNKKVSKGLKKAHYKSTCSHLPYYLASIPVTPARQSCKFNLYSKYILRFHVNAYQCICSTLTSSAFVDTVHCKRQVCSLSSSWTMGKVLFRKVKMDLLSICTFFFFLYIKPVCKGEYQEFTLLLLLWLVWSFANRLLLVK